MIILKFLDPDCKLVTQECKNIPEALDYDYKIWASLGENCDFYYGEHKLILDTVHWDVIKITEEIKRQIKLVS